MSPERQLRVHVQGVHAVYEAEWHSLVRRAGHVVASVPEEADVHLCMSPHRAEMRDEIWMRLAETDKPVILGRCNPGHTKPRSIRNILGLGIRNHIIAHRGFADHIRETAEDEGVPSVHISYIPKCYDLDEEACNRFQISRPFSAPVDNPEKFFDVVSLIHNYRRFFPEDYSEFERVQKVIASVHWYGEGSPEGRAKDTVVLATARFLIHLKGGGCVDNAPARAVACGVPVITTEDIARRNLTDEIVVQGVSGYLAKDTSELITTLRTMSDEKYLRLRRSTWEFGERFRSFPADTLNRFNEMLDDALRHGTTAAESMRYVEQNRGLKAVPEPTYGWKLSRRRWKTIIRYKNGDLAYQLNPSMARIYRLCDGDTSIREIISAIEKQLPSRKRPPAYQLRDEVVAGLKELRALGLVYFPSEP